MVSYLQINDARLHYRDEGRGAPVIFVHGWTLDLDMWEPQMAELAASFRIIRLDRRGFGLSSGQPSLMNDVADLNALRTHLDLPRIALVGMSQGARVVLHYAQRWPDTVLSLVVDGPPQMLEGGVQDIPYENFRQLAREQGVDAFRLQWVRHPLVRLITPDTRASELLARMIARYAGKDLTQFSADVPVAPLTWIPETIRVPTLVMTGALDSTSRQGFADSLASQLPFAERAQIPAAGHLCSLDNPSAYNAVVRNFLARTIQQRSIQE